MSIVINFLLVIHVLVSLLIILLTLMQRPKNEGLGAAFGGGMTENLFGAQTTNVLQTITRWLGGIFFILTLLLSFLYVKQTNKGSSVLQKATAPSVIPQAPATPPAEMPIVPIPEAPSTPAALNLETPAPTPPVSETPVVVPAPVTPSPIPAPSTSEPASEPVKPSLPSTPETKPAEPAPAPVPAPSPQPAEPAPAPAPAPATPPVSDPKPQEQPAQ